MIKTVIFDLDGTLYRGKTVIAGAVEKVGELRSKGIRVLFFTNAATRSRKGVAEKLLGMGFEVKGDEIYCGSYVVAHYVREKYKGKSVMIIGEDGFREEIEMAGIKISEKPGIVVVGLDRELTYEKLCNAHKALMAGALLIASNKDHTYPTENGSLPGSGSIVSAIEYAGEVQAQTIGKPNPYAFELIKKDFKLKNSEVMMVGDRLNTDILFAKNAGIKSTLVLSGSTNKEHLKNSQIKPDYVTKSIRDLTLSL